MSERSIFANLIRDADGSISTTYGPFTLQSALQPILRETGDGGLQLAAMEGLIRASRSGTPCLPSEFFSAVEPRDRARIDSLCRNLHILNAGALRRKTAILVVKLDPALLREEHAIRLEIDRMRIVAREAAIAPERIACEIRRSADETAALSGDLARQLHEHGFKVAIDGYNGDDSDLERLKRLEPDLVKFDSAWLSGFVSNSAGLALLRVLIGQFHRDGILPIVSGIEEPWQIELCRDLGSPLMEGYLIARPELAPTGFNLHFPEDDFAPPETATESCDPLAERSARRGAATFGKRGA